MHENYVEVEMIKGQEESKIIIDKPMPYIWGTSNEFGQMGLMDDELEK